MKTIKLSQDTLELHNALIGLKEQIKYIEWLCQQLDYVEPPTPTGKAE